MGIKGRFVGIDLSWTRTALVALDLGAGNRADRTLSIPTQPKLFACRQARLRHIRQAVLEFVNDVGPQLVAVEGYSFGSKAGRELAGELGGAVRLALWEDAVPFIDVPPTTLKKFVTGKGNCEKNLILREVFRKWGYAAEGDDEADAFALAKLAVEAHAHRAGDAVTKQTAALLEKVEWAKWTVTVEGSRP